jgi:hypothetical protein
LKLCEGLVDHRGLDDLVEGVFLLELGVGVVLRVGVVDATDFGKVFELGAVPWAGLGRFSIKHGRVVPRMLVYLLLHVFATSVTEQLRSSRRICDPPCLLHDEIRCACRIRSVLKETLQRTWKHLLEPYY